MVLWGSHLAAGHHLPSLLAIVTDFRNPSLAWQRGAFPTWLYLLTLVVMLGVMGGVVWLVARLVTQRRKRRDQEVSQRLGLASRSEVQSAAGAKQLVKRGGVLRPSLPKPVVGDLGLNLGVSRRIGVYFSAEDSMIIVGPPRSGKGYYLVIRLILDALGAVIVTGTRPDNMVVTMHASASRGPVTVFSPQGLSRGAPTGRRWSPVRGCEDPATAMARAVALCAGVQNQPGEGKSGQDPFWHDQATILVQCLLHAVAIEGLEVTDLYRLASPSAAREAAAILAQNPRAASLWAQELDAILSLDPKTRGGVFAFVANVLSALANPEVRAAMTPADGEEFDPEEFLRSNGTLYLLGTNTGAGATANFVSAFIEDIITTAQRLASGSPGQRLDPPLSLILDEAANFSLPSLPTLMSAGGGSGITTVAVFQSLAQARDRWGEAAAQAIWDSATYKIILGGGSNASDLADLSRLMGDYEATETSTTRHEGGASSISESTRSRPILEVSTIRSLKEGTALLLLRRAKPIVLTLSPWTKRRDADVLRANKAAVEEMLIRGAREGRRS
jgi:type IV secretory pathway TraG/TraD family ATPase VirD4